jgi:hypothetical protein
VNPKGGCGDPLCDHTFISTVWKLMISGSIPAIALIEKYSTTSIFLQALPDVEVEKPRMSEKTGENITLK